MTLSVISGGGAGRLGFVESSTEGLRFPAAPSLCRRLLGEDTFGADSKSDNVFVNIYHGHFIIPGWP